MQVLCMQCACILLVSDYTSPEPRIVQPTNMQLSGTDKPRDGSIIPDIIPSGDREGSVAGYQMRVVHMMTLISGPFDPYLRQLLTTP